MPTPPLPSIGLDSWGDELNAYLLYLESLALGATGSIPLSTANSGTAYTVTASSHGEKRLKLILTGNATLSLSGGTAGEVCAIQLHLIQDATGSRTVTWPGSVDWGINGPPVLSAVTGKTDQVYLTTDDGGISWQGALIGNGYTSPVAPSAPTSVGAAVVSGNVVLTWTQGAANGSTVIQNKVYRSTSTGTETLLATVTANTTYTDTAVLADGTTYYYKISAVNGVGESALSSEVNAVPGLIIVASDNFNRADATATTFSDGLIGQNTPVGTKTWLNLISAGNWSVASNRVTCNTAGRKAGINSGVSNCTVTADCINSGAAANEGLIFRWVDSSNYCTVIVDPSGYVVQKVIAGGTSTVASGGGAVASGASPRVSVVLNGTSVIVKANGVTVITTTIADAAVLTGTRHGFLTGSTATGIAFDNFEVTTP